MLLNYRMENENEIVRKIKEGEYSLFKPEGAKSVMWAAFSEIKKDNGSILDGKVYCQFCEKLFKFTRRQTSNLLKHKCVHAKPSEKDPIQINTEDRNSCFQAFMDFIIEDCRAFSTVEGSGFKKLISKCIKIGAKYGENVDVDHLIPCAQTLSRKCKVIAEEKKQEIGPRIQHLISKNCAAVTIDLWTDNFIKRNFLCATLHFHLNSELVEITLGMKSMDLLSSSGINIRDKLNNLFGEFGVTDISNAVFVTDRGSNVKSALKDLNRINCSAHLFSNVLSDAFEATIELREITDACKKIVKYIKKSGKQQMLKTTLKNSCPTRWNSNFVLFKSISDNYTKLNEILADDAERRRLLNFNVTVLNRLVELCSEFEIVFKQLQYSSVPTICFVIPCIRRIETNCTNQSNDEAPIKALKKNIMTHLDKWKSNLSIWHKAALFLYPPAISLQQGELTEVKDFCTEKLLKENCDETLLDCSGINHPLVVQDNQNLQTPPSGYSISPPISQTPQDSPSVQISLFFPTLVRDATNRETARDEVERYANEIVRLTENFDPIMWWKNNDGKYPRLSKMAINLLSIPASSAASERVFSLAGNIITEKRNRLVPKTVDSILFLNSLCKKNLW